ncbi:cell adhesion molecule 3 isoform X1 [Xiphophorus couchianus]|uniref:cell adhesion molecule 3 isoform X1 n=1 Tax=Xiphophorus couchianus TaxID=32473 RepID=UPI001015E32E|nr:cell adhesion molecule 3 isoform X1 [Xiphophorus couchianus]XP_027875230.1 cell adhesion molecule 3 isoform X1 [Xiphophorus couchianus]
MAFPSAPSALWIVSLLTALFTAAVHSNIVNDEDPLQPMTSDETVSVGGMVTLTCRVAETDNSSLQWSNTAQQTLYFGEKRALRDNRIQLHRSTPTELSINISDVQLSDEGEYTCSIFTMPVRTARATVTVLGVPGTPQISGFENPVPEGEKVTLTCTSTGSKPPAKLRWYKGDIEVQGRPDVVESVPDDPTYNVSSELTLEVTANDDDTKISCVVDHDSVKHGEKKSEQSLRVLYAPDVAITPEERMAIEGQRFSLQCSGKGNPEPTIYSWEKAEGELPPLAKADGAFLSFSVLNKSDNGMYICHADNGIGKGRGSYTLQVQDDPDSSNAVTPTFLPTSISPSSPPDVFQGSGSDFSDFISTFSPDSSPLTAVISTTIPPSSTTTLSNALFPDLPFSPDSSPLIPPSPATPSLSSPTPSVSVQTNGVYTFTGKTSSTLALTQDV